MRGSRKHLVWSKDRTRLISITVDALFAISQIEGDLVDLDIKVGMPFGPVKMRAKAKGYDVIPNQWETPYITVKQVKDVWCVDVKAKHTTGETISITVKNPNLADAKAAFWARWNGEVKSTGWHTHLYVKEGMYRMA